MTDHEVWELIFDAGLLHCRGDDRRVRARCRHGRGQANITALGGTVEIESSEGRGMRVTVRLPLTLAIMDGMSVGVGDESYILPLASVIESFQVPTDTIKTIGGRARWCSARRVHAGHRPGRVFEVPRYDFEQGRNHGGGRGRRQRGALLVDELLGQQQVVVKNLEANYRKVSDVSGATIMGDGRVALILDVGSAGAARAPLTAPCPRHCLARSRTVHGHDAMTRPSSLRHEPQLRAARCRRVAANS